MARYKKMTPAELDEDAVANDPLGMQLDTLERAIAQAEEDMAVIAQRMALSVFAAIRPRLNQLRMTLQRLEEKHAVVDLETAAGPSPRRSAPNAKRTYRGVSLP